MRNRFGMRSFLLLAGGLVTCWSAWAADITSGQAEKAVATWIRRSPAPLEAKLGQAVDATRTYTDATGAALFHVVRLAGGGFVVTSADDGIMPIVAFSDGEDLVEDVRNPFWALLNKDLPLRLAAARGRVQPMGMAPEPVAGTPEALWADLLADDAIVPLGVSSVSDVRVSPLVLSTWDQAEVAGNSTYNYYTPNNYVCGCVATAGAQIMRYHQYPTASVTAGTYTCFVDGTATNLTMQGGVYAWSNMPLTPDASTTLVQRQAIGKLTSDVGIASSMDYWSDGSGAYGTLLARAFTNRFGYASACSLIVDDAMVYVQNGVLANLDAGFPVMLGISGSGGGHEVVGDGYGYQSGLLYVHLNMGWSGYDNAWYNLPTVDPDWTSFEVFDGLEFNLFPTNVSEIVSGRVLDGSGLAVSGVTVAATNLTSGGVRVTATSNAKGIYAVRVPRPSVTANWRLTATVGGSAITQTVSVVASQSTDSEYDSATGGLSYMPDSGVVGSRWGVNLSAPATVAPAAPLNVAAGEDSTNAVHVAWTASAAATGYAVYRHTTSDSASATRIGGTAGVSYDDTSAVAETVYWYWVKATNSVGSSAFSSGDSGRRRLPVTLGGAVDATNLTWTTGGDVGWTGQFTDTHDGDDAARSGDIGDDGISWMQTTVTGPGTVSFWWKVDCEDADADDWDFLRFLVDGVESSRIDGATAWAQKSYALAAGTHTLRWSYEKDYVDLAGEDCGWVDQVVWTPGGGGGSSTVTTEVPVPYSWLDQYGLVTGGDYEGAALADVDGDGFEAWQEYVAGSVPTNIASFFQARIAVSNGARVVTWSPDLGASRVYVVEGKSALTNDLWQTPTNAASRFFGVNVDLP